MSKVTIVKLGGSAITDKAHECTPDIESIHHVADQLAAYHDPLILVHGGGSYAHPFVTRASLEGGLRNRFQLDSVSETEFYLNQLTRIVWTALFLRDKPSVPLHPMSFATLDKGKVRRTFLQPMVSALRVGLTPLTHGDLVFDESRGIGVLSGDRIASLVGVKIGASRVLLGCDVDGVYSENPKTSPTASLIRQVTRDNFRAVLDASSGVSPDATGGMRSKVEEAIRLAKKGCECHVFNLRKRNALRDILKGNRIVGTRFAPWGPPRMSSQRSRSRG